MIVVLGIRSYGVRALPEVFGYDTDEDTFSSITIPYTELGGVTASFAGRGEREHNERTLAYRDEDGAWRLRPPAHRDAAEWESEFDAALGDVVDRMSAQERRAAGIVDAEAIEEPLALPAPPLMLPPAGGTCVARA